MNKAERLLQTVNLLRNRRTVLTAKQIAERLDVSERTVYRDIQSLMLTGVPVEGEAGVGYRIQRNFELPPLMFDKSEVEALLLGARMVRSWSDKALAASANSALNKILAVLPPDLRELEETSAIRVPQFQGQSGAAKYSERVRLAITTKQKLLLDYRDVNQTPSERLIWPLGLFFWGAAWTLVAWCELRNDFRIFRLDRMQQCTPQKDFFTPNKTQNLDAYLESVRKEYGDCGLE